MMTHQQNVLYPLRDGKREQYRHVDITKADNAVKSFIQHRMVTNGITSVINTIQTDAYITALQWQATYSYELGVSMGIIDDDGDYNIKHPDWDAFCDKQKEYTAKIKTVLDELATEFAIIKDQWNTLRSRLDK